MPTLSTVHATDEEIIRSFPCHPEAGIPGYVVGFLPIGLAGFLFIAAPGFMDPMFMNPPGIAGLPAGVIILLFGGIMMFIGFMLIRRIVDIEV